MFKTFMAGAFLGAGVLSIITHGGAMAHISSVIPAVTVADLIESGGAVIAGVLAIVVVGRQERLHSGKV